MNGRTRRSAEESRQLILAAAAELLSNGGVDAVQVRAVAASVGMTDAGVNHHFGTRSQLLEALLIYGGHELHRVLDEVLETWLDGPADVAALIDALAHIYRKGYAQLALSLHAAGWRETSNGMLNPVVDAVHERRKDRTADKADTRLMVAALHQAIALESEYGSSFRRSAGFTASQASSSRRQLEWWKTTVQSVLR